MTRITAKQRRERASQIKAAQRAIERDEVASLPWTNDRMTEMRLNHLREALAALACAREHVTLAANGDEQRRRTALLPRFEIEVARCRAALGLRSTPQEGARR